MPSRIHQTDNRDKRASEGAGERLAVIGADSRSAVVPLKQLPKDPQAPRVVGPSKPWHPSTNRLKASHTVSG